MIYLTSKLTSQPVNWANWLVTHRSSQICQVPASNQTKTQNGSVWCQIFMRNSLAVNRIVIVFLHFNGQFAEVHILIFKPRLLNWGFRICLQPWQSSLVYPMSFTWHNIGWTEDERNLWRTIQNPQLKGRSLHILSVLSLAELTFQRRGMWAKCQGGWQISKVRLFPLLPLHHPRDDLSRVSRKMTSLCH